MPANKTNNTHQHKSFSFENTGIAFRNLSDTDLKHTYWLFRLMNNAVLVKIGISLINFALKIGLPVKGLIKATIFKQFCGGETITKCGATIKKLSNGRVGTILDYSVEGEDKEAVFDNTRDEIIRIIEYAAKGKDIPLTVFKVTGIGRFELLEKLDSRIALTHNEENEWQRVQNRILAICDKASKNNIPVMIDAEESWIQHTIDILALTMMSHFNKKRAIVYNTYQMYRVDKLSSLLNDHEIAESEGFILGAKIVRGAYMEKERIHAEENGYPSPIHADKKATDLDYDSALDYCTDHVRKIAIVAGTHNEESCRLLMQLMKDKHIVSNNPNIYFAQLLGMGDNISFNLSDAGYNVAKYVPYGPIKAVLPYLTRRAQENTAIAGQMSRELNFIIKEKQRRKI